MAVVIQKEVEKRVNTQLLLLGREKRKSATDAAASTQLLLANSALQKFVASGDPPSFKKVKSDELAALLRVRGVPPKEIPAKRPEREARALSLLSSGAEAAASELQGTQLRLELVGEWQKEVAAAALLAHVDLKTHAGWPDELIPKGMRVAPCPQKSDLAFGSTVNMDDRSILYKWPGAGWLKVQ